MRLCFITDPFAEADDDTGDTKKVENHIHIRIQRRYFFLLPLQTLISYPSHRIASHLARLR